MTIEKLKANSRGVIGTPGVGEAGSVKVIYGKLEVSPTAEAGSTYTFGRIPSNARLLNAISYIRFNAKAEDSTDNIGAFSIGIFGVNDNITDDDSALFPSRNIDYVTRFIERTGVIYWNQLLWKFVSGKTKDPGGFFDIKVTLKSTLSNNIGSQLIIRLVLAFTLD